MDMLGHLLARLLLVGLLALPAMGFSAPPIPPDSLALPARSADDTVITGIRGLLEAGPVTVGQFLAGCSSIYHAFHPTRDYEPVEFWIESRRERTLQGEFRQASIELDVSDALYTISFIVWRDTVVCAGITTTSRTRPSDAIEVIVGDASLTGCLLDDHRAMYGTDPDLANAVDSPFPSSVFGFACSITGAPPTPCRAMLRLVRENDARGLARWLRSMSPEIRLYGACGLRILSHRGAGIMPEDGRLIAMLARSSTPVRTCEGCEWPGMRGIGDILTHDLADMKELLEWVKESGWGG